MASATPKNIRLIRLISISWTVLFFIRPALSEAGLANTKHDIYSDKEKNCTLCHVPHSDQAQNPRWMTADKPGSGDRIKYFAISTDEEVMCLSCHDGVAAEDICVDFDPNMEEEEIPSGLDLEELNHFYKRMVFFGTCEKHYKLASYFPGHFPDQLKCTTCHDVHLMKGSVKAGLISNKIYYKHKLCLVCHQDN